MPIVHIQDVGSEQELIDCQARFGELPEPMREMDEDLIDDDTVTINAIPSTSALIPLQAPVPPQLEEAIRYQGQARHVAFYWQPAGDEAMYDDAHVSGDGNWLAWLAYVDQPADAPHLLRLCQTCNGRGTTDTLHDTPCLDCDGAGVHVLNLGSPDYPTELWLILDREARKAYTAPVQAAQRLLAEQRTPEPQLSAEDEAAVVEAFEEGLEQFQRNWQPPGDEELAAQIMAAKERCADVTDWLDGQVAWGGRHCPSSPMKKGQNTKRK